MINGILFRDMIISASNNIENHKQIVNDLNVFPVPDGDTGTNMSLTMKSAKKEMEASNEESIGKTAVACAGALLKGARGNSGVILSLLFRGISKELAQYENAGVTEFAQGLEAGVKSAYAAVMKPTEGTMLTVARVAAESAADYAKKRKADDLGLFETIASSASDCLDKTPDMLPILKQANVVDAGGKGVLLIFEAMLFTLKTGEIISSNEISEQPTKEKADFSKLSAEDIKFQYCTEFIIMKEKKAVFNKLQALLHSIGDSVVAVDDDEIIKVHVHTNDPGKAISEGIMHGSLINIKIDNMKEQQVDLAENTPIEEQKAEPVNETGFVAVCSGNGIADVFRELGVGKIVEGGQTMNPSTDDIVSAIYSVPAKNVIVFPNNKNIVMAAQQAAEIISDRNVLVIPSKTIPQGISSMLTYMPDESAETNYGEMETALKNVKTGQVTFAARDSVFDGKKIKEGQFLGLVENKIELVKADLNKCTMEVIKRLVDDTSEFITVFCGCDTTDEQAEALKECIAKETNCEINVVQGGQPVYYYIISVE